jgi:hypothetical protein
MAARPTPSAELGELLRLMVGAQAGFPGRPADTGDLLLRMLERPDSIAGGILAATGLTRARLEELIAAARQRGGEV